MLKPLVSSCLVISFVASLVGCGAVLDQNGAGGAGAGFAAKPTEDDLTGKAGSFGGTWQGPCTYTTIDTVNPDCQASLEITQDPISITATLSYSISGSSRRKPFDRYTIKGNSLITNTSVNEAGKIGKGGFQLFDNDVSALTGKLNGGGTLNLIMTRLPSAMRAANKYTGFTATLTRVQ